jgi:hypothetical protein
LEYTHVVPLILINQLARPPSFSKNQKKKRKLNSQVPLLVHPILAHCPHSAIIVPVLLAVVVVLFELVADVFVLEVLETDLAVVVTLVTLFLT